MKIADIIAEIETYAPLNLQESYDNSGYMCGSHETSVKGVLLAIEITERVVDEAIEKGCNLIISHHPIIFKGIKSLSTDNYVNRPLIKAIKNDITIYAAHTNIDSVSNGVSMTIAQRLGLNNLRVLDPKDNLGNGLGLIGELPDTTNTVKLLHDIKRIFNCNIVKHSELCHPQVKRVAVCGGAGAEFIEHAIQEKADIYITGDIKHHDWYRAEGKIVIADIGHYESEQFIKELFYNILIKKITNFAILYSQSDTNPVFVV